MEPTLSLKKSDFESEVGDFMGLSPDPEDWNDEDTARVRRDIGSGLRRFYYPIPPYDWSFLRPFVSLTLASGARTVALPDDFGGMEGRISISDSSSSVFSPISFDNPGRVQELYSANPSQTGRPQVASERPIKAMAGDRGQRSELYLFPQADQAYTLTFQYYMNPGYLLDDTMPYAYGGAEHSETILEACLAVAEERRHDIPDGKGVHSIAFAKRLLASMALDRRKKPQRLGRNADSSDDEEGVLIFDRTSPGAVTVNGVEYS